ncbi:MAG: IPT/TIG domain-containing protein [Leptospiraceae bacterium]|nr:IPT/TIG domain-containing protein [Leptospiraceae bacterium]
MKFLFVVFVFFFSCKGDDTSQREILSFLLGLPSSSYNLAITNVVPKFGSPKQSTTLFGEFPATKVTISGRNFSLVPSENIVRFNGVQSVVDFSSTTEIRTTVPTNASTGVLSVSKIDGNCSSLDKKSGYNCSGTEFYLNCYSSYNSIYGEQNLLTVNKKETFVYDGYSTKAFRVDLTNRTHTINIICKNLTSVKTFSNTCVPTDVIQDGSTFLSNPTVNVSGGYTLEFFVSTLKSDCTILVL